MLLMVMLCLAHKFQDRLAGPALGQLVLAHQLLNRLPFDLWG